MEDHNEKLLKEMEQTRTALTEKLEALENKIAGQVQAGADVVERTTDAAVEIVESVKETVHEVTEKVEQAVGSVTDKVSDTVQSVVSVFDLQAQTQRHPWVVLGVAAATGCVIGSMLGRSPRRLERDPSAASMRAEQPRKENGAASGANGNSHRAEAFYGRRNTDRRSGFWNQSWFKEETDRLKGLALGIVLSALRDIAKQAVPGPIGERIAEEVENFTTHLGAEPVKGAVLPERRQQKPGEPVNRVFAGKSRPGTDWPEDAPGGEG